jgi:LIM domain kinase 1
MSPEIINGLNFDLPTDVFSLGIIFIEIMSRRLVDSKTFIVRAHFNSISFTSSLLDRIGPFHPVGELANRCSAKHPLSYPRKPKSVAASPVVVHPP